MSREELEKRALEARYNLVSSKDKETIDILEELATKALEQEPILDKISDEMQKEKENIHFDLNEQKAKWVNSGIYDGLTWAQEIIDKYRKEQE